MSRGTKEMMQPCPLHRHVVSLGTSSSRRSRPRAAGPPAVATVTTAARTAAVGGRGTATVLGGVSVCSQLRDASVAQLATPVNSPPAMPGGGGEPEPEPEDVATEVHQGLTLFI